MSSHLNLVLLGPPGAGKGTQAMRIRTDLGAPLVSTGEILRTNVKDGTVLGQAAHAQMKNGGLVEDDLIVAMVNERLTQPDAAGGFLLDGFPRTLHQADALTSQLAREGRHLSAALVIDVPDAEILDRVAGRRVCAAAGHNYHIDSHRPQRPGRCDLDGSQLIQRDDDNPAVVRKRLQVYHAQSSPIFDYYEQRDLLHRIDGTPSPDEVYARICAAISSIE